MIQYNGGWYCNGCLYTYLAPELLLDVQVSLDSLAEVAQLSNSRLTGHVHKYNAIQLLSLWVTLPDKAGTAGFLKSWTMLRNYHTSWYGKSPSFKYCYSTGH